jgi:DNA-binding beta-propeller fold protein YncE
MQALTRTTAVFSSLFLALTFLFFCPLQAHADGGAPNLAYVSGTSPGVSVIDVMQRQVAETLSVAGNPASILLSSDGRLLYVTQPALGQLTVIAAKNKQVVCTRNLPGRPTLLTLDPGMNILYVAGDQSNLVTALDPTTCDVRRTLQVSGPVSGLAVAVIGGGLIGGVDNQLWVANAGVLTIFNTDGKQQATIPLPEEPQYISIPTQETVYVTTRQGSVLAVDVNTRRISKPLLTNGSFGPMDYDATTGEVYVPDQEHNLVDVLTPVSVGSTTLPHEPNGSLHFTAAPQSVAITNDGRLGFVALENGEVAMLDLPARQIISMIKVGGLPRFVITGAYPALIQLTPQQSKLLNLLSGVAEFVAIIIFVILALITALRRSKMRKSPPPSKLHKQE